MCTRAVQQAHLLINIWLAHVMQVPTESLSEIQFAPLGIITESFPPDPAAAGRNLFKEETRRLVKI